MRDLADPRRWLTFAGAAAMVVGVAFAVPALVSGQDPAEPAASTGEATGLRPDSARLRGVVDPNGVPTKYVFQYGRTASYGMHTEPKSVPAGGGKVAVRAQVGGLEPGTDYHYRVVAVSDGGFAVGGDRAFATPTPQLVGRFRVKTHVIGGGKPFGQRRGDGGGRQYRFKASCPGAKGESCAKVRLRRAGKRSKFGSVLRRRGLDRWSGSERFHGRCDNGLSFRTRTRIAVHSTGLKGKRVDRITGRLRSSVRGCVAGSERATLKGRLR